VASVKLAPVRRRELRFGGWEVTAAVLVAAVAGAVAGAAVERAFSRHTSVAAVSHSQTVPVSTHAAQPRPTGRSRPSRQAAAWLDAPRLRRLVAGIGLRDHAAVGVAVRSLANGSLLLAGDLTSGAAWSTIKVPIVLARYRLAEAQHEGSAAIDPLAARALTESDNAAAAALFDGIASARGGVASASAYVGEELRDAGDRVTAINTVQPDFGPFSTYGQTEWSLDAGTAFYRQLARSCVPPADAVAHVLELMADVTPSQRWGIGAAVWPGASSLRFKGGWGPGREGRYLVRQFGIIESADGRRGFVVGLIARPDDGEFGSGIHVLDDLSAAAAATTKLPRAPAFSPCRASRR
jgi:hypothetical protein